MSANECLIQVNNLSDLDASAKSLLSFIQDDKIVLFDAEMGSGKTTFIKAICKALGSHDNFSSPTFSLVNEYLFPTGKIFHFDLYRLKNQHELLDIGIEEYLDSGAYCFVEWPEILIDIIDVNYVNVTIKSHENIRYIRATKVRP